MRREWTVGTAIFLTLNIFCFGSPATAALDQYLREQKTYVTEGHISVDGCGKEGFFIDLLQKENWVRTVGEIGFNAGHSSVTFLAAHPTCKVFSFDIMVHPYAKIGKQFVDARYPSRHVLVEGNSLKSVPAFHRSNPSVQFDLIFIDGGHDYSTAYGDLLNMSRLATPKTLLVVDDINFSSVAAAWSQCIEEGVATEVQRITQGSRAWVVGRYVKRTQ
jgi:predicted O-methyltransferase YrrM